MQNGSNYPEPKLEAPSSSLDLDQIWHVIREKAWLIGLCGLLGILGGLAGLSGPLPILWASVRGWGKDERRGVFQTYNWTILLFALCLQATAGLVEPKVLWLALVAFPGTVLGAFLGTRVYHALSDRNFADVVLGLLIVSGIGLLWSSLR